MKKCPFCAGEIQDLATLCEFCNRDLPPASPPLPSVQASPPTESAPGKQVDHSARSVLIFLGIAALGFLVVLGLLVSRPAATVTSNTSSAKPEAPTAAEATPPASSSPRSPAVATSKWQSGEEGASEMDDATTVLYQLDAENEVAGWLGNRRPTLVARCQGRRTAVYVVTGMAANPEYGGLNRHTVRIRFDEGKVVSQTWAQSTDSEALFAPDARTFARQLARAKRLTFRFTPYNASPATAQFDVSGFGERLPVLAKACGWRP